MLGGLRLTLFWPLLYISGFCLRRHYIANADMKDGLLIENQAMLNAGFKTGDKIISVDGTKKFDNDINMKVVLGKRSLSKETEPGNHKMPIDFIDQLSKF
jgi:regulator of sigma E protease